MTGEPIYVMIDKRGSITLPSWLRKKLNLKQGALLEVEVVPGGAILLHKVKPVREILLSPEGLQKLSEARNSGLVEDLPDWLEKEMADARAEINEEIPERS